MRLISPAIRKITKALKYALGIQSVNLTGNPGVTAESVEFAATHLQACLHPLPKQVKMPSKETSKQKEL
jgi:hypothetical protein